MSASYLMPTFGLFGAREVPVVYVVCPQWAHALHTDGGPILFNSFPTDLDLPQVARQ